MKAPVLLTALALFLVPATQVRAQEDEAPREGVEEKDGGPFLEIKIGAGADGQDIKSLAEVLEEHVPSAAEALVESVEARARVEDEQLARLSPDQLFEVMLAREKAKIDQPEPPLVAMVAPLGFFLCVIGVVYLVNWFRTKNELIRHETIRQAMERGVELPVELMAPKGKTPRSDLRRGLVLVCGGLGLMVFLGASTDEGAWAVGAFPLMIGMGYIAFWWFDRMGWDGSGRGLKY